MAETSARLEALLHEVGEIRTAMERVYQAIYTSFGVVLPGAVAVFAFVSKDSKLEDSFIAFLVIVVLSLGAMWTQNLWMELLRYVRYYYIILMPRVYAASDQGQRCHLLQYEHTRTLKSWTPITCFNGSCLILLIVADVICFQDTTHGTFLGVGGTLLILAAGASTVLVIMEAVHTENCIKGRSTYTPYTPRSTPDKGEKGDP